MKTLQNAFVFTLNQYINSIPNNWHQNNNRSVVWASTPWEHLLSLRRFSAHRRLTMCSPLRISSWSGTWALRVSGGLNTEFWSITTPQGLFMYWSPRHTHPAAPHRVIPHSNTLLYTAALVVHCIAVCCNAAHCAVLCRGDVRCVSLAVQNHILCVASH